MRNIKLESAMMSFKLEDGSMLCISDKDIQQIATRVLIEAMTGVNGTHVYMVKDESIAKAKLLFDVLKEGQKIISDETFKECFTAIANILNTPLLEFEDIKKQFDNKSI